MNEIKGLYTIAENVSQAEAFLKGGARIVQLRRKDNGQRTTDNGPKKVQPVFGPLSTVRCPLSTPHGPLSVVQVSKKILALKRRYDFTFIVNDYVEVAKEIGADGVHVGADDMPVAEVRKIVGPKMLIGYSSHSLEEAVAAEKAGANYVAFGAIFPTKTKGPGHPVQGLEKLRGVVQALRVPVVAIGGINKSNMESVMKTGAAAVAMITALTEAADIVQAVKSVVHCPLSVVGLL